MLTRVKCRRAERDRLLPHLLPCSLRQQLRPHSPGTRPPAGTRPATTPRSGDEPSKCLNGSREKEQTSNVSTWTPTSTDRTPPTLPPPSAPTRETHHGVLDSCHRCGSCQSEAQSPAPEVGPEGHWARPSVRIRHAPETESLCVPDDFFNQE